jgi:hypothetical protein
MTNSYRTATVAMSREEFLRDGFICPVPGCLAHVTAEHIVKWVPYAGERAKTSPGAYKVRCPKCWESHWVALTSEREPPAERAQEPPP